MDLTPFVELTIELIIGFSALFITTKLLRRTQINQITPFEFISALVLGELLGNAIYDDKINIVYILYAISIWTCLMYTIEILTQKVRRTRKFFEGDPAIVIRNGQIDLNVIKKQKLDINELLSLLRQKDVFSIREVEFAILESNGMISVLKKSEYSSPTIQDLNIQKYPNYLSINLILDGEIIYDNLKAIGYDEKWLIDEIHTKGIEKTEDILYAEWMQNQGIYVVEKK